MSVLTKNIDAHPYTGVREVTGKVRVVNSNLVRQFISGTNCEEATKNITIGKIYDVVRVEGFGDCEDVVIIDDAGEEHELGDFFFEEVDTDVEYFNEGVIPSCCKGAFIQVPCFIGDTVYCPEEVSGTTRVKPGASVLEGKAMSFDIGITRLGVKYNYVRVEYEGGLVMNHHFNDFGVRCFTDIEGARKRIKEAAKK